MKEEVLRVRVRVHGKQGDAHHVFLRTASIELAQEVFVDGAWCVYLRAAGLELIAPLEGSPKIGREEEAARYYAERLIAGMV